MKKLSSSIAAMLVFAISYSQGIYSYVAVNDEQVRKEMGPIAADNNGNTIISGQFENSINLGGTILTGGTYGAYNAAFVAKVSAAGTIVWAKAFSPLTIPNDISSITVSEISTDAAGNIYMTGSVSGKIGFGVPKVSLSSTKNGNTYTPDIFTLKMSEDGMVLWAKADGTANDGCMASESGTSITTDNAGNVYVTGRKVWKVFKNTTVCNDVCPGASSKSLTCPIVLKYSSSGQKLFEKLYINNGAQVSTSCWANRPSGTDIRTDGTNIYVSGYSYGTVDFGTGPLSTGSETTNNSFLLKLTGDGTTQWAKLVTGNGNKPFEVGDDLFVDGNDIYISGIGDNISFGTCSLPAGGGAPSFLAKYSSSGSCQWVVKPRGTCYGVVRHPNGNVASLVRRGASQPFRCDIKEFSPLDGTAVDSTCFLVADTATGAVTGYPSIAQTPDGFVFSQLVTGTFHFGDLVITASIPKGGGSPDMMLIRYTEDQPTIAPRINITPETKANKIILYPNPATSQLTLQNNGQKILGTVSIYDMSGQMIYKKFIGSPQVTIDVKNIPAGVYYIRSDQLPRSIKFVKQ